MSPSDALAALLSGLTWVVLGYFLVANGYQTLLLCGAGRELVRHRYMIRGERLDPLLGSAAVPRLSVLAPAYNEAATVATSVRSLLTLHYSNLELVLVNDGSTDATLAVLQREFELSPIHPIYRRVVATKPIRGLYQSRTNPQLLVVDKDNGRKADSLNAGLNVATGELVCAIDADTILEPDALLRILRPFLDAEDVVAAGATIRVVNGASVRGGRVESVHVPRRPLPGIQWVEYLRAFLYGRLGWNQLGGNLIISGAFGVFRRDAIQALGGYVHDTVGEDMELVVHLRSHGLATGGPSRVVFVPDPIAWTEVPESLAVLGRQRDRWQRGLADVLRRYRSLLLNPRWGVLGLLVFPYFVLVELLGPVIEGLGLLGLVAAIALGAINLPFAALFLLVAYGWGVLLSLSAVLLDQSTGHGPGNPLDLALLISWSVLENLGYRQLTVIWRLRGILNFLRGRQDWGTMVRRGFNPPEGHAAEVPFQ
ncbi:MULTISPECIES: glycosyltransferase family 2 protein [unclassified Frankia]|uniref:glycosyltransferase family 2 protein n=1 Tax=unclassified Frankia TaxID=2632575 RepID=UPI001EF53C80|nr:MULTISPECIES: glycosyltransferase [unclassified Frankia]